MQGTPDLYHPVILELSKNPPHFARDASGACTVHAINHYCGDKFQITFDLDVNVQNPTFQGYGCAVSKAATAVLVAGMGGRTLLEVSARCKQVLAFLNGAGEAPQFDPRLQAFAAVRAHPGRLQCATLSWQAVLDECDRLRKESPESV
ncbi:MAG: iron-sulfur cluster assembly scaffold protein [Saprospiraceae bacterium]|nr:iron-sulfur cluster assembly scaffold protein [Saprospiraceae bacterium]